MQPPRSGPTPLSPCGSVGFRLDLSGAHMHGRRVSVSELTRALSLALGRIVMDRTGYMELFDVQLQFRPDETTEAMPPPPPGAPDDFANPSILEALQEQLGLRLESTKGPVEIIVVDHIERPSAN